MKKIIIVGAGPAGITAGYELKKKNKDFDVIILEATQEIGGISKTVVYHGNRMDMGGHRFFSKSKRVNDWWKQMLPLQGKPAMDDLELGRKYFQTPNGPNPEKSHQVMLYRKRISRIYYEHHFFDYPIKPNLATLKKLGVKTTAIVGKDYIKSRIHVLPETSLENFYINRFGKQLYEMFFRDYTKKLWGVSAANLSADWGSQRVKGLSIGKILQDTVAKILHIKKEKETSLIEQFLYPKLGPGQLWEYAAEQFMAMGGTLKKGCIVTGLKTEGNVVKSVQYEENGIQKTETADIVISTMPLKDLAQGLQGIPKDIAEIALHLPYRDFVTIGVLVKKLKLKNDTKWKTFQNQIPDCWIYVQDRDVTMGRIQIFNNWSPYMVKNPQGTVWMGLEYFCKENDEIWNRTEKEWKEYAADELIKMGMIDAKEEILDLHCEHVKKAYPAYYGSYAKMDKLIAYFNQIDNLYCIGRNGQHRYNNMDHSMMTAFEAVDNICSGKKQKENIWNVNIEKIYHEQKE